MTREALVLAVAAALGSAPLWADSAPEAMSDLVVEGQAEAAGELPLQDFPRGMAADAADLLRSLPGVSGVRMGGRGIDPVIRGQSQTRLNVLLDGAYIHGGCPNRMDPPTSYAPIEAYDEVIVIKGSQTVRYGGGGSGGSVLFTRRTPRFESGENLRGRVSGGYTSGSDTRDLSADVSAGAPDFFARAMAHYKDAGNYDDGDGNRVRSAYRSRGANLAAGWTPAADQRLELGFEATREADVLYAGAGMDAPTSDADTWRLRYEQGRLGGGLSNLKAELYHADVFHQMDNYSLRVQTAPRKMLVDSDSITHGGRVSLDLDAGGGPVWTLGADYQRNERDATRFWDMGVPDPTVVQAHMWPGVELKQPGLFVEVKLPRGSDALTAGLRYDQVHASVDAGLAHTRPAGPATWQRSPAELYREYYGVGAVDAEEDNLGGFLRYEHSLAGSWSLSGGLSRSVRTADATERYLAATSMDPTLVWVGNPGLAPEKHHQAELGVKGGAVGWSLAGSLFYDRVDDYILRDRAHGQDGILMDNGATVYRNVEARLWGAELELEWTWFGPLSSRAVISYVNAQNLDDDRPIAQTPPLEGSLSLDYQVSRWSAGALVRWADEQTRVDDDPATGSGLDARETPGWVVLDLYGKVRVGRGGELKLGIDNLLDNTYAYHVNRANSDPFNPDPVQVNEPGRTLWARASLRF